MFENDEVGIAPQKPTFDNTENDLEPEDRQLLTSPAKDSTSDIEPISDTPEVAFQRLASRDWQNELSDTFGFAGKPENAAHLMRRYVEGMTEAYKIREEQKKVADTVKIPNIGFDHSHGTTWFDTKKNKLYISLQAISQASSYDPNTRIKTVGKNDEVTFLGTMEDSYLLEGVEELTHSLDKQREILSERIGYISNKDTKSVAEYDSSDLEYRGLGMKVLVAERKNLPQETQGILKQRLSKAIEVRRRSNTK